MSFFILKLFSTRKNLSRSLATPSTNTSKLNILFLNSGTHIGPGLWPWREPSLTTQFFHNPVKLFTDNHNLRQGSTPEGTVSVNNYLNSCRRSSHAGTLAAINQYMNQSHNDSSDLRPSESVCYRYNVGWFRDHTARNLCPSERRRATLFCIVPSLGTSLRVKRIPKLRVYVPQ